MNFTIFNIQWKIICIKSTKIIIFPTELLNEEMLTYKYVKI